MYEMDQTDKERNRTVMANPSHTRMEGLGGRVFLLDGDPDLIDAAPGATVLRMYEEDGRYMGQLSRSGDDGPYTVIGRGEWAGTAGTPLVANVLLRANGWTNGWNEPEAPFADLTIHQGG